MTPSSAQQADQAMMVDATGASAAAGFIACPNVMMNAVPPQQYVPVQPQPLPMPQQFQVLGQFPHLLSYVPVQPQPLPMPQQVLWQFPHLPSYEACFYSYRGWLLQRIKNNQIQSVYLGRMLIAADSDTQPQKFNSKQSTFKFFQEVFRAIADNRSVTKVDLSMNPWLSNEIIPELIKLLLVNSNISVIELRGTNFSLECIMQLWLILLKNGRNTPLIYHDTIEERLIHSYDQDAWLRLARSLLLGGHNEQNTRLANMSLIAIAADFDTDAGRTAELIRQYNMFDGPIDSAKVRSCIVSMKIKSSLAYLYIGLLYMVGAIDNTKNTAAAIQCWNLAAIGMGEAEAYKYLGFCCIEGKGTAIDLCQGLFHLQTAADNGDFSVFPWLGNYYYSAPVTPAYCQVGLYYLYRSWENGNRLATSMLEFLHSYQGPLPQDLFNSLDVFLRKHCDAKGYADFLGDVRIFMTGGLAHDVQLEEVKAIPPSGPVSVPFLPVPPGIALPAAAGVSSVIVQPTAPAVAVTLPPGIKSAITIALPEVVHSKQAAGVAAMERMRLALVEQANRAELKLPQQPVASARLKLATDIAVMERRQLSLAEEASRAESKLSAQLAARAQAYGLQCVDVANDGNCFFSSVADQLISTNSYLVDRAKSKGIPLYMLLRQRLAKHLQIFFTEYQKIPGLDTNSLARDIALVAQDGRWIEGELYILALSRALNISIVILLNDSDRPLIFKQARPNTTELIILGHESHLHYQSLRKQPNQPIASKLLEAFEHEPGDNWHPDLTMVARFLGFKCVDVPNDANSLFAAVADQLAAQGYNDVDLREFDANLNGNNQLPDKVRERLVKYLQEHFDECRVIYGKTADEFRNFIAELPNSATRESYPLLFQSISRALRISIVVVGNCSPSPLPIIRHSPDAPCVYLGFDIQEAFFKSLRLAAGVPLNAEFLEIIAATPCEEAVDQQVIARPGAAT